MSNHTGGYLLNYALHRLVENGLVERLGKEKTQQIVLDIIAFATKKYDCNEGEILDQLGTPLGLCFYCLQPVAETKDDVCLPCRQADGWDDDEDDDEDEEKAPARPTLVTITGVVVRGHQVASQRSGNYPCGTISLQRPFFYKRGLDLSRYYPATLNVSINPKVFKLVQPRFTFRQVDWTPYHPPEDFSFARCQVKYKNVTYDGWIYYPHPETKQRHFQNPSLVEVIAPYISGIAYGDAVELAVNPDEVLIESPQ